MPKDLTVCDEVVSESAVVSALQTRVVDLTDVVREMRVRVQRSEGLLADIALEVRECRVAIAGLSLAEDVDVSSCRSAAADEVSPSAIS